MEQPQIKRWGILKEKKNDVCPSRVFLEKIDLHFGRDGGNSVMICFRKRLEERTCGRLAAQLGKG